MLSSSLAAAPGPDDLTSEHMMGVCLFLFFFFFSFNHPFFVHARMACSSSSKNAQTTIMAVEFDGGVVLGADSRTTTGAFIANRVTNKITPIADRIFCCRSGSAADTQTIADHVRYNLEIYSLQTGEAPSPAVAARLFRLLCYENKGNLMAGIICAGWDEKNGGQVYSINLGGASIRMPFCIGGSGSTYVYGYCDANYRKGMTKDECLTLIRNGLCFFTSFRCLCC